MEFKIAFKSFKWLFWRDLRILSKDFFNNILDAILLPCGFIITSGYIMPQFGLPEYFGSFMLVGSIIGMCFNSPSTYSGDLTADLEGPKTISYELILPLPYWLVYIKIGLVYAVKSIIVNIFSFPIGIILLFKEFDLTKISFVKFLIIYPSVNILFGFFALCVAVWVKNMVDFGRFWIRWGWQLFIFAGFQFSWLMMYKAIPWLGIFNLLNPLLYPMEAMRVAILGQKGYINFWICFLVILFSIFLFTFIGLKIFKKRLDCV